MTILKILTACWANLFLTDLPVNGDVRGAISQQPERARTCYFAGLKALHESFLINQVLCYHSKYSLSDGQNESRLGKHGKIPYTSTSRRTSPWNTPCYLKPLWHNGCQYVRSHHSKGHLYLLSGWRDSPPNRPFYPWVCFQCDTQESITQQAGRVLPRYLTCLKALFTGFHMLYHLCR